MYFNCKTAFKITSTATGVVSWLGTVISVKVKNESKNIGSDCELDVPLNCRISYDGAPSTFLNTQPQNAFAVGDHIQIYAGYSGMPWITVFDGFIWDFVEGNPVKIKCLDYLYFLQQGTKNYVNANISIQNLVQAILPPQVTLLLPTIQFNLVDISFIQMSPYAILRYLKEKIGLNISLMGNKLYMNIASNTTTTVYFRTDRNIIKSNLQRPVSVYRTFKIVAHFERENGTEDKIEIGDPNGMLRECWFYKVQQDLTLYNNLAKGFLYQCQQERYSGIVETWLYPNVQLFQIADYTDVRYPSRSGQYVITQNDITLDKTGFHRKLKFSSLTQTNG